MTSAVIDAIRATTSRAELTVLMEAVAREMGFRYYALIHHGDLGSQPGLVDIKDYPPAIVDSLFGEHRYRRDPVIRGCIFADSACLWSELPQIIRLDRRDHASIAMGAREGLNEGITVPYSRLGHRMGSCTFAGTRDPDRAGRFVGATQMIGIFAFQAASRLSGVASFVPATPQRLHPRPRDCVVLAGRGYSNKEIARALGISPRTVDCYMTAVRLAFDAHDRTELVVSAVLAGEVGVDELARRKPG